MVYRARETETVLTKRLATVAAAALAAGIGLMAMPHDAKAWRRGGFGVGVVLPPVVVAPPPVYPAPVYGPPVYAYRPPLAYYPPRRVWVPPHWRGPYWVPGHWA